MPGRPWALFWGAVVGLLVWVAAPTVQGDGLFHLARARKLLSLDALSLDRVSEFADGSLHPGYAFPLWHGFIALIAKVAGEDPERVVVHLPSILAPLAVVVAFEAGWALFRRTWAAGVTAGAQVAMICFAPGLGGAYVFLSLPATAARQLLVPAALALAFESVRSPSLGLVASTAAAGLALAVVHPTYAIFLWIPFVGFLATRALWERKDLRNGTLALVALVVPAALFLLWLRPIVNDTRSVSPDADELRRAFEQYRGQLVVHSDTSYNLAPEVFTRAGAVAIAALLLIPLAGLAARRRWAAYVVGGSLAVFAVMLLPFLFPALADLVSISQARRAAGFLPFAFAFAGGFGVLARLVGPILLPLALGTGMFFQIVYPGDFDYVLKNPAPAWIAWLSVAGAVAALVVGLRTAATSTRGRRGSRGFGVSHPGHRWRASRTGGPHRRRRSRRCRQGSSMPCVTMWSRARSSSPIRRRASGSRPSPLSTWARRRRAMSRIRRRTIRTSVRGRLVDFFRTGDLSIPRRAGAEYVIVDGLRSDLELDLPIVYQDGRFTLYRL